MKAYHIHPDENWSRDYRIDAFHKWALPGVSCSRCGFVGGAVGSQYPAFSLPIGIESAPYLEAWPVTPERQVELQVQLWQDWGQELPLSPGAKFGPLVGKASGEAGDFAWVNSWTPLLSASAVEQLRKAGVLFAVPVDAELKWRSQKAPHYLELQILAGVRLAPSYMNSLGACRCSLCGLLRCNLELPDRAARLAYAELENNPVLEAASLPTTEWDLLRIRGLEATIVASERFRSAVLSLGLTHVTFREIEIASP